MLTTAPPPPRIRGQGGAAHEAVVPLTFTPSTWQTLPVGAVSTVPETDGRVVVHQAVDQPATDGVIDDTLTSAAVGDVGFSIVGPCSRLRSSAAPNPAPAPLETRG